MIFSRIIIIILIHPIVFNDIHSLDKILRIRASKIGNVAASKLHKKNPNIHWKILIFVSLDRAWFSH